MNKKNLKNKKKEKINVHEHLEICLKKTTYAHRLLWLEQANEFVRSIRPPRPLRTRKKSPR